MSKSTEGEVVIKLKVTGSGHRKPEDYLDLLKNRGRNVRVVDKEVVSHNLKYETKGAKVDKNARGLNFIKKVLRQVIHEALAEPDHEGREYKLKGTSRYSDPKVNLHVGSVMIGEFKIVDDSMEIYGISPFKSQAEETANGIKRGRRYYHNEFYRPKDDPQLKRSLLLADPKFFEKLRDMIKSQKWRLRC
jgi:hypothetical protein